MTTLHISEAKDRLKAFITDWYFDIMSDIKQEVISEVDLPVSEMNFKNLSITANTLLEYEKDRDGLIKKVEDCGNLYDVLHLLGIMCDGNYYPFCEAESTIFQKVFDVKVIEEGEDDIVVLTKQAKRADKEDDMQGPPY